MPAQQTNDNVETHQLPSNPKEPYIGPAPVIEEFGTPTTPMDACLPKFGLVSLPQQMPVPFAYFDSRKGFGPDGQQKYVVY